MSIKKPTSSSYQFKCLFKNIHEIIQVCSKKEPYKYGLAMNEIASIQNGCLLVNLEGKIEFVGTQSDYENQFNHTDQVIEAVLDCKGKSILPGFIDGHTHPVFAGDRVHEFDLKLKGATYLEIHQAGGGIGFTVQHTRKATEEDLFRDVQKRFDRMMRFGTTFVEAKSGYGLDTTTELKMLRVLTQHNRSTHPLKASITYLGGHSVPKDKTLAAYTQEILHEQIPAIRQEQMKNGIQIDNIDVFYERGVFERPETIQILELGKSLGWTINFHGDELHPMNSGEVGAQVGARAISHLEEISEKDIQLMAEHRIFATLLPTTAYVLRIQPPPARKLIDSGVPVALGSDYNPNAHCLSMPQVMNLACVNMRMTMNEALVAATINAAASLKVEEERGSLEPGKYADLVLIDHTDWRHVIYEMVDPPIHSVYIKGKMVHTI